METSFDEQYRIDRVKAFLIETPEQYEKLVMIADRMLKYVTSKREGYLEGKDMVNDLMIKIIEGGRDWDYKQHPDLYSCIKSLIKSEVSNYIRNGYNSKREINNDTECSDEEFLERKWNDSAEHIISEKDDRTEEMGILDGEAKKFSELEKATYEGWKKGLSNKEIALANNVNVNDIVYAKKRVQRRFKKIINQ